MRRVLPFVLVVLLTIGVAPVGVAAPTQRWVREIGSSLRSVAIARDGSVYAVGERPSSITRRAILVKLTPQGEVRWTRSWLPDVEASTHGVAVDVMPDGRIVWVGRVQGQCEGGGWFLEIRGPAGKLLARYVTPGWQCSIAESIRDVAVTDGMIVVAGYSHGCCGDIFQDGWVRAFDGRARPRWRAPFEPPAPTPRAWFDRATGVAIGRQGTVYASGWAATQAVQPGVTPASVAGTVMLQKLTGTGRVLWSRRASVSMPSLDGDARVASRKNRVMVTAPVRGLGAAWSLGGRASDGWLGRFTPTGRFLWGRSWDTARPNAAEPADLSIDRNLVTWVTGTRRDAEDTSLRVLLVSFGGTGALRSSQQMSAAGRWMFGTGVAARNSTRVYVTGASGTRSEMRVGLIWRMG